MTDYSVVPTYALKNYVANSRKMVAEWNSSLKSAQEALDRAKQAQGMWVHDRDEQEAELRSREPEFGGTYQHADGFSYQSFRGRSEWTYRIMHTPVSVVGVGNHDGYEHYQHVCAEHGSLGMGGTNLAMMLSLGFKHFLQEHA